MQKKDKPAHNDRSHKKRHMQLPAVGEALEGAIFKITDFGAFVKLSGNRLGLIHISQIAEDYVKNVSDHLKVGDRITARVVGVRNDGKIDLTLKAPKEQGNSFPKDREFKTSVFEEKINEFLQQKQAII
jgi:S1 RNA binding domain protein